MWSSGCLYKKRQGDTDRDPWRRRPCEDTGRRPCEVRDWSDESTSQGTLRIASKCPKNISLDRSMLPFNEHHIFMTLDREVNTYNQDLHVENSVHLDHALLAWLESQSLKDRRTFKGFFSQGKTGKLKNFTIVNVPKSWSLLMADDRNKNFA